ncbi:MAG: acyl-CoA dehydrogenase [Candidatus Lokiarchaeota archaeon]|nr:acyl-CoA dehydrogenase [Candidatus Lokiarchaeota archaeon]
MIDAILTEDQIKFRDETRNFCKKVNTELILKMDSISNKEYPKEFVTLMKNNKLLGVRFPKKYGGRGLDWVSECLATEEIGIFGAGLGCSFAMPSIVGEALNTFGTEEQKQKYLAPICKGEKISAEGLTEPRGGSDFFGTISTAIKKGDKYIINGEKRFVAGGIGADIFLIYAKTNFKEKPHKSITTFIIERDWGLEVEEQYDLLGFRGMGAARIVMKDLEVPEENIIGGLNGGGNVFNTMMVPERLTSGAGALGIGRAAMELAIRYSDKRVAFGQKIRQFQGINFKVAETMTQLQAARLLVYYAARKADQGLPCRKEVSQAKLSATEAGFKAAYDAMQIVGGISYTDVYPLERMFREARLGTIWTGSNEVMKMIIQNEIYKEILSEDINLKRNIEMDTPGASKEIEKVYFQDISKYLPK